MIACGTRWSGYALPYYFWLGLRGFVGAFLWLAFPLLLLGLGHRFPLLGLMGAGLFAIVVLYVPFMQVRFARTHRFRAFIEVLAVRQVYRRAARVRLRALGPFAVRDAALPAEDRSDSARPRVP